ncbi:MAG: hypothetical protein AB7Q76_18455 [Gammaproteobacteria bacterium]
MSCLLLATHVVPASGEDKAPLITKRQQRQEARIRDGMRSGALSSEESASLMARQRAIKVRRRAMAADGKLNRSERTLLRHEQQAANRDIQRAMNDSGVAPAKTYRDDIQLERGRVTFPAHRFASDPDG